jgi:hypothetical protein
MVPITSGTGIMYYPEFETTREYQAPNAHWGAVMQSGCIYSVVERQELGRQRVDSKEKNEEAIMNQGI